MSSASHRAIHAIAVAGEIVFVGLCLAWAVLERPAPLINVRWREGLSIAARRHAEARLYLEKGEPLGGAIRYEVASPRSATFAAIVAHPDVLDTHGIDRRAATLTAETGRGALRVWWAGPFRGVQGRRVFRVLLAIVGVIAVVCATIADRTGLRFAGRSTREQVPCTSN